MNSQKCAKKKHAKNKNTIFVDLNFIFGVLFLNIILFSVK